MVIKALGTQLDSVSILSFNVFWNYLCDIERIQQFSSLGIDFYLLEREKKLFKYSFHKLNIFNN